MSTALVLSAGGMFAAWEVGVWMVLRTRFQFDLVVGASAGAWNGWAIAGGCTPEELVREWMNPEVALIMKRGFYARGFVRPDRLHQKARDLFARYQPRCPFGLTVLEVPRWRPTLVRDSAITWHHLAATAAVPLIFPPVRIGGRRYVDGGVAGALPLWAAEEMGATRAIGVNSLTTWQFRALRKILWLKRPSAALQAVAIEPSAPLGSLRDAVIWSPANVERWIAQGERDAKRAATSITM